MRLDHASQCGTRRPWLRRSSTVVLVLALPSQAQVPSAGQPPKLSRAQHKALTSAACDGQLDAAISIYKEAQASRTASSAGKDARQSLAARNLIGLDEAARLGGRSPLHVAAQAGHATVVSALLSWQANPATVDHGGQTPLHYAASHGHDFMVSLLLSANADAQAVDSRGQTPLHVAARWGHASCMSNLSKLAGSDINFVDASGRPPLQLAAQFGHPNAVAWLLEQRAMVDTLDRTGFQTALHAAVAARPASAASSVVALLLEANARVHSRGWRGRTPLHHAAASGATPIVRQLLQAGARRNIKDDEHNTPRALANNNFFHETVKVLETEPLVPSPPPPTPDVETLSNRRGAMSFGDPSSPPAPPTERRDTLSGSSEWLHADVNVEVGIHPAGATSGGSVQEVGHKQIPKQSPPSRDDAHPRLRHGGRTSSWNPITAFGYGSAQDGARSLLFRLVTWMYPTGTFSSMGQGEDSARSSCEK
mmetsp:Transcript_396/g.1358  ORF Transcript_396/g.1358 Transcript_396/m.1358 type:complete len:480 (-) Transcript_396:49-1488(-)